MNSAISAVTKFNRQNYNNYISVQKNFNSTGDRVQIGFNIYF